MKRFIQKHYSKITGTLSCFDRVMFKGHLPINWAESMEQFISGQGLLIKDFKNFVSETPPTGVGGFYSPRLSCSCPVSSFH